MYELLYFSLTQNATSLFYFQGVIFTIIPSIDDYKVTLSNAVFLRGFKKSQKRSFQLLGASLTHYGTIMKVFNSFSFPIILVELF